MANELDKFDNEIEAVAEEQVELDEFKASFDTDEDGDLNNEEQEAFVAYVRTQVQNAEPIIPKDED